MANTTIQSSTAKVKSGNVSFGMAKNTKSFENFSYFLGGIDVTHQNLNQFTPYIKGVSRIFMHKPPLFLISSLGNDYSENVKNFKTYIETGYKGVSGIADIDVEFTQFQGGFNGQEYEVVQGARDTTSSVTIQVYELSGSPIREFLDLWVTGTRDIRSGIAHYHGAIEAGLEYSEQNHTAEFIYVTYDPTGLKPEYSCMFAHCFPRRVPKDHLNYSAGDRDNAPMDLEFATTKYESPAINDIAIWYTNNSKVKWNYLDFDPNMSVNGDAQNSGYMRTNGNVRTYDYGYGGTVHSYNGDPLTNGNAGTLDR